MKTSALISALSVTLVLIHSDTLAKGPTKPPRILGIAAVSILSSDIPTARGFYRLVSDPARSCNWCEDAPSSTITLNHGQTITLKKSPAQPPSSFLQEITFRTDSLDQLAKFLSAKQVQFRQERYNGQLWRISLLDPEGHLIAFAGLVKPMTSLNDIHPPDPNMVSPRIVHAGFVVQDRVATDHFYKDILGFRPYWHGGMKDDKDDWVAMQVPDGTDWVEYMLNISPTADKHTLGVMNHIAIGVADIKSTTEQLREDRVVPILEEPKLGRDGKWQLNLYDPDDTRVEFMEFTPKEKPCCSEFTGPHPGPKP